MRKMNRCFASTISFFMLAGLLPTNVQADLKDNTMLTAVELEGTSLLDELEGNINEVKGQALYGDDEFVTAIVELEEAPVMDYYDSSSYFSLDEENSAGESVSKFLASDDIKEVSEELLDNQKNIISEITTLVNENANEGVNVASISEETVEVINNWTTIVNAISIRVPYRMLDKIRALDGVKRAYVEHVYDRPEPIENSVVEEGKATYSYSYDMVGVEEAWNQGYTGKGMLVAVLDSGLDIKRNWWDAQISRVHEAFTDNSFKSGNPTDGVDDWDLRYTNESLEEFLKDNQLISTTGADGSHITYDNNMLYKNVKVPYAADYADGDLDVSPLSSNHGTHVAGTIAGFASTEEGEVKFSGIAPDAQILAMKVFPDADGGAQEGVLINALEDSLRLGADMINLSLGSDNGFADDDSMQKELYKRVNNAGIVLMTAAGNSEKSSDNNNYGGNSLTSNPDESMMSSPAIYESNLSVASIDNTIAVQPYLSWKDEDGVEHNVYYNNSSSGALKANFDGNEEYPIYAVGGVGTYDDYAKVGFNNGYNNGKTGFALVKRGEISFADKINNALSFSGVNSQNEPYGVLGVIVYDNDPNGTSLITMSADGAAMSSAFISGKDGATIVEALEKGYEVKIKIYKEDATIDNSTAGQMSSFTSWGSGQALELKPEITAPGGNIWSTVAGGSTAGGEVYTGSYAMMSGTSMATPHMSGIGLLVREYINKQTAFEGISSKEVSDLVSQLLVSTAVPQKDENGVYYSPRQQGSGLVNTSAAMTTPAYITVDGQTVGKLELGDDPEKTGVYDINFNLNNMSSDELKYNVEVVLMRPDTTTVESTWGKREVIADNDVVIKTFNLGKIRVAPNSSTSFNESVSLKKAQKKELNKIFENGTYIEGYVILTDATKKGNPDLGLPMLAFYGDWTKSPIFDSATWLDEPQDDITSINNENSLYTSIIGSTQRSDVFGTIGYLPLGLNAFDANALNNPIVYHKENITLSPNGDEYFDRIDYSELYQLRDAKLLVFEVKDDETGEVYMRDWASYSYRSTYDPGYATFVPFSLYGTYPTWYGTDMDGQVLPSGTKCTYTITAYGEGEYGDKIYDDASGKDVTNFESIIPGENEPTFNGHEMDMTGDVISFPVTIDTVAPKLENNAVSIYEKDGRTFITGKIIDEDGSIASVQVAPIVTRSYQDGVGDPNYSQTKPDRANAFYVNNISDAGTKEITFTADVTEYVHKEAYPGEHDTYKYEWTGNVVVSCGDYGANERSYAIKVDATEGIVLSQTSALLHPGQQFELSVNNNTDGIDNTITRTSSNPEVATVDEYGVVKAIAPGQTIITVSAGGSSAICVVAVEEKNDKLIDFDLSIEEFSGLKPDGEVVVKVTNIQPATAKIENIRWEVLEDEDFANDYAAGLISVSKNTADALSGFLFLTVNYSEDVIPAGHAVLTVTIDGIQKSMDIDWDEIYSKRNQDDIISARNYNEQTIYVTQGETANLIAKYRQNVLHEVGDITTEFTGVKLDGADFFNIGGSYTGKLVNEEGYKLPSDIKIYTVYPDGYKVEMINNPYQTFFTYNSTTGEIDIRYAPTGADNKILIVANGIESPGAAAGTMSGATYTRPEKLYGPFDWKVTEGNGALEVGPVEVSGSVQEGAAYTPSEPGVSYITATTKDGQYSVNFAVVSEPVKAEEITLNKNKAQLKVGETTNLGATISPMPTLEADKELVWTSFNPEVATVSEDGTITAVSEGYAYIKVELATDNSITNYCIVKVEGKSEDIDNPDKPDKPNNPGDSGDSDNPDDSDNPGDSDDSDNQGGSVDSNKPGNVDKPSNQGGSGSNGASSGNINLGDSISSNGSNSSNSPSKDKIPATGGDDWKTSVWISLVLCSLGILIIAERRKEVK